MTKKSAFGLTLACVALLLGAAARAGVYNALRAYEQKDFTRAFEQFRELAELGQVDSQEFLVDMYVNGEGVARNNALAYAWAKIAKENGSPRTQPVIDQIRPHLTPKASETIDAVYGQSGPTALSQRVLPKIFDRALRADYEPCGMAKAGATNRYPAGAITTSVQGSVYVEFTVMPDGHARNPRIVYAVPVKTFDRSSREIILNSQFTPATTRGVPEPCTMAMMIRYKINAAGNLLAF